MVFQMSGGIHMVVQSHLSQNILDTVALYQKILQRAGIMTKQLIVFGSQATGKVKPWSDIDVCVVSDAFGEDRFSDRLKLMHLRDDKTLDIEPHPMSPEELQDHWDPFAHEIRKYGISV